MKQTALPALILVSGALALSFPLAHGRARADQAYDVRAHYEKREVMIPMRDGTRLFTIIYSPRDTSRRFPFLLNRTAYGIPPYGADAYRPVLGPYLDFTQEGYIFVYQDARGTFKSEGQFVHHVPYIRGSSGPNESTDATTPSTGCWRTCPTTTGVSASAACRGAAGRSPWG